MAEKRTEEVKRDAVRIALSSGLPRREVVADLRVGLSTLDTWIKAHGDAGTCRRKKLNW